MSIAPTLEAMYPSVPPIIDIGGIQRFQQELDAVIDTCSLGHSNAVKFMDSVIREAETTTNFTETEDYKTYGLVPGVQLSYGGAFGVGTLRHFAVYIYGGTILEVGSGPEACKLRNENTLSFKDQSYGFSTLSSFSSRAKKNKSQIFLLMTDIDIEPHVVVERLERARELVGCWNYNILLSNCQHAANYVSFGIRESEQATTAKYISVLFTAAGALAAAYPLTKCLRGTCMKRRKTKNRCVCESAVYTSFFNGRKWCYVDEDLCKGRDKYRGRSFDYVDENSKDEEYCLSKSRKGKMKYAKCGAQTSKGTPCRLGENCPHHQKSKSSSSPSYSSRSRASLSSS